MYNISVLSRYLENILYNLVISSKGLLGQIANKTKELKLAVSPWMALVAKINVRMPSLCKRKPLIHTLVSF